MKPGKKFISTFLLSVSSIIIFTIISQTFSESEQIFITDSIFITPKTQPVYYVLLMLVSIGLVILAIYLGLKIAGFLLRKGILFQTVGAFLLTMAGVLSYVFLISGENMETTKDFIIMLILILFVGIIGFLIVFISKTNKNKRKNKNEMFFPASTL